MGVGSGDGVGAGLGVGVGSGTGAGSGISGSLIMKVLTGYEASRTCTYGLISAADGAHGEVTEEAAARSPLSVTVVQSCTGVSILSAPICTAHTYYVPAMPPATSVVTSTDALISSVYV